MKLRFSICVSVFLLLCSVVALSFAQTPTAVIKIEALSPHEIEELGWTTHHSPGLDVVGIGELVYLSAHEASDSTITGIQWQLTNLPSGSQATLDSTATPWTTFRPDTTGAFTIQLTVTTAGGSDDTTVVIRGAKYIGVGNVDSLVIDPSQGECWPCHTDKITEWAGSGHPQLFKEGIDGIASSHYGEGCIECHTLGYNLDPEAINDGFDDVQALLGWTFPAHPGPGQWDSLSIYFPDLAKRGSIQCENCHGPASEHKTNFDPAKIDVNIDEGVCANCHDEPWRHIKPAQWKNSPHDFDAINDLHGAGTRASCQPCHSGSGFIEAFGGGVQHNPDDPGNVSCAACHDPHKAEVRTTGDVTLGNGVIVTSGGEGKLCMQCHKSRRDAETYAVEYHSHFGPHHGPQADMLNGTNVVSFGFSIPSTTHNFAITNSCVTCHMAPTPGSGTPPDTTNPAQYGRDEIGEHTFTMSWDGPNGEIDLVSGCVNCHGPKTSFEDWIAHMDYDEDGSVEPVQDEVEGMLNSIGLLLPPLNDPAVVVDTNYTVLELQSAYNYFFVEEDGSYGIHNLQFAVNLLKITLDTLRGAPVGLFDESNENLTPTNYSLSQNYPNPFNPTTTIEFNLPKQETVKLVVYDLLGKPIRTLVSGRMNSGSHRLQWDGKDQNSEVVSSGVYIYRLEGASSTLTRKMLLVK